MIKHAYNHEEKLRYRVMLANSMFLDLIRAAKKAREHEARYKRTIPGSPVRIWHDTRWNIYSILIDLPGSRKPLVVATYISAQVSRPLSPSQTTPKILKLYDIIRRYPEADKLLFMLAATYTSTAYEMLREAKIMPTKKPGELMNWLARYFKKRYVKLIDALRGKRVFGELLLLAYILHELMKLYGEKVENDPLEEPFRQHDIVYLAIEGLEIKPVAF